MAGSQLGWVFKNISRAVAQIGSALPSSALPLRLLHHAWLTGPPTTRAKSTSFWFCPSWDSCRPLASDWDSPTKLCALFLQTRNSGFLSKYPLSRAAVTVTHFRGKAAKTGNFLQIFSFCRTPPAFRSPPAAVAPGAPGSSLCSPVRASAFASRFAQSAQLSPV